jgi:hypothetical protein
VRRDGTRVVLKLGMPHMEGQHELDGLRFWRGEPTVRLHEADRDVNAMLLERCEPGTSLRALPEDEQDPVIAGLLHRLWRKPSASHPFRPLSVMIGYWAEETNAAAHKWNDPGLVREGLRLFDELSRASGRLITFEHETLEEARESRRPSGAADFEIEGWITSYAAIGAGDLEAVSDCVQRFLDRPPKRLGEWLRENPESYRHLLHPAA